jgi:hypothetical protein
MKRSDGDSSALKIATDYTDYTDFSGQVDD